MTTIVTDITGIASIPVVAILIRSGFSRIGTASICEKVAVDRLAILLLGADQRQALLGFLLLPWQRPTSFATGALGLEVICTPVTLAVFECPVIRLIGIDPATVRFLIIRRVCISRPPVSLATLG